MNEARANSHTLVIVGLAALFMAACVVVLWVDPSQRALFPVCPLHRMTGLNCPGCGGLRATHHLLHGRWLTAFHHNPLYVTGLVLTAGVCLRARIKKRPLRDEFTSLTRPSIVITGVAIIIAFGILRNLPYPAFAWMSP